MSAANGAQPGSQQRGAAKSDEVRLLLNNQIWSGWTAIRIGRGIERFPSDFEVAATWRYPGTAGALKPEPGTPCVLKIGDDVIITGYVDRFSPAFEPNGHQIRIQGRSRCCDLVDCAAGIDASDNWTTQVSSQSILSVVQFFAKPFGIAVTSTAADAQKIASQVNVNLSETVAEIVDRVCRWGGLLYYDTPSGDMVLAQVGAAKMASGFQEGVNVEAAGCTFSMDQRFSEYIVLMMSTDAYNTVRQYADGSTNGNIRTIQQDNSNPPLRFRPHIIISEQTDQANTFAQIRAVWEMNRRNGRARAITLTTDSWRDSAGTLWQPNALVPVNVPTLNVVNEQWIIGEVTYRLDETGTHADLVLMPPGAYTPEPFNLQPVNWQVGQALSGGAQPSSPPGSAATNPNPLAPPSQNQNVRAGEGSGQ